MKRLAAIEKLRHWDALGRCVFTRQQLARIFYDDEPKTFAEGLNRLVHDGLLVRASRGIYVHPHATSLDQHILESIAVFMRRGCFSYVSLESALSEYGAISQVPVDRLTVMTTGRRGTHRTPYGVIEFTHTKRNWEDILCGTRRQTNHALRMATLATAWRDLKRVGRNVGMVDQNIIKEAQDGEF